MASETNQMSTQTPRHLADGEPSTPESPTHSRHPLSRYESIAHHGDDELATSFQSTDTVRRRPEGQTAGYGECLRFHMFIPGTILPICPLSLNKVHDLKFIQMLPLHNNVLTISYQYPPRSVLT